MIARASLKKALPGPAIRIIRLLRLGMLDLFDGVTGRRPEMTPPRRAIEEIGGFDFQKIGAQLAAIAIDSGALHRESHAIDAGCGYGRLAVPLTRFLTAGSYLGFDISRPAIRWCSREISSKFPRFAFVHLDVRNGHYNPRGRFAAEHVIWPAGDSSAGLVFAGSLFTHLTLPSVEHYLREAARVLSPGGRCIASFFLLNEESRAKVNAGRGQPKFQFLSNDVAVQDPNDPEAAIAFDERTIRDRFVAAGFRIIEIKYGSWCERFDAATYQDFVIAEKVRPTG
ncbi:MAG: class I SAM-dependent methyltransferase [Thermoanaerobaculia bacterium]